MTARSQLPEVDLPPVDRSYCRHCGDPCGVGAVVTAQGAFCCAGCDAVFAVLHAQGLGAFYACPTPPGVSQRNADERDASRFAALDDVVVRARFLEFDDGRIARAAFSIPAMHCASCVWLLERLSRVDPAIVGAEADVIQRTVRVTYRPDLVPLSRIAQQLAAIGYEPQLEGERPAVGVPPARRRLYSQLGVAGFAFGNVMLFSIPRYVNGAPLEDGFQRLFNLLNVALTVPVLVYSASDYFRAAWRVTRRGAISLDVPIAMALATLFGRSVWDIALGRGEGFLDSFAGLVFFLLVAKLFQQKAFDRIAFDRTFRSFLPLSVRVEPEGSGQPSMVPIERLRPGDRILVRPREVVPADAVLIDATARIDYALLSGEEAPVAVEQGETVRAGGRVVAGSLRLKVLREVSRSRLAGLWNAPIFSTPKRDWLTDVSARFGQWFVIAVGVLAAAGAVAWWPDAWQSLQVATAVLIIACPCALTLAAPMTLGTAMGMLGRSGLYLRNPAIALSLSRIDTVVLDKTGTLTDGRTWMRVEPKSLSDREWQLVQRLATESTHPASRAVAGGRRRGNPSESLREVAGGGLRGVVDGYDVVLGSAAFVHRELGLPTPVTDDGRTAVAIDGRVCGSIRISAGMRPGIEEAVRTLATTHSVVLLSGDSDEDAPRWRPLFGDRMWFRRSPEDKLAIVRALQQRGRHVVMVGDGLNDAGALEAAEVGMGVSDDTACIVPACDAMIRGDRIAALPAFLRFARRARRVITICFLVSIAYNALGLWLALSGSLTPLLAAILMPVSSLMVMGLGVGLTRWHARVELPA